MNVLTRLNHATAKTFLHTDSIGSYLEPIIQRFKPAWRTHWFRARVLSIKNLDGVVELLLSPEKHWPQAKAGQHVLLTLEVNGRLMTRPFSISSGPQQLSNDHPRQRSIRLTIKVNTEGGFTPKIVESVLTQRVVNISAPQGDFVTVDFPNNPVWFVAAGSGITPFLAMLHHLAHLANSSARSGANHPIHLVYFAKALEHLYVDELLAISKVLPQLRLQLLVRQQGHHLSDALLNCDPSSQVFVCGPAQFKHAVDQQLDMLLHPQQQRRAEYYQAPVVAQQSTGEHDVLVIQRSTSTLLTLTADDNLLTGLEQQGIRANFGCRIGVCHQCRCVKKSGVVRNLRTGELSQQGEQLIQLCISQAVTSLELEL